MNTDSNRRKEIAARVAMLRRKERYSQAALANAAGITRDQLANIELNRTELKFWVGWRICKALNINQRFLAEGKLPERPFWDFNPEKVASKTIVQGASFGAVCATWLAGELTARAEQKSDAWTLPGVSPDFVRAHEACIVHLAEVYIESLPEDRRQQALEHLLKTMQHSCSSVFIRG